MKLLALDTSTERMSLALGVGGQVWQHESAGGALTSAQLIPTLQQLMAQAGLDWPALDAIVFGRGPGSFTGLRTACSVAQGLAYGAGQKLLPVDSLLAVAEDARHRLGSQHVLAVLDARMDQVYQARYQYEAGGWITHLAPELAAPEALLPPAGATLAGNIAPVYGRRLAAGQRVQDAWPRAEAMLRLAPALLAAGLAVAPAQALPLYVRDKVAQTSAERSQQGFKR